MSQDPDCEVIDWNGKKINWNPEDKCCRYGMPWMAPCLSDFTREGYAYLLQSCPMCTKQSRKQLRRSSWMKEKHRIRSGSISLKKYHQLEDARWRLL